MLHADWDTFLTIRLLLSYCCNFFGNDAQKNSSSHAQSKVVMYIVESYPGGTPYHFTAFSACSESFLTPPY